jgi:hypothetical protein|tara:strand:+ start:2628 stop:3044 length:417 start_codon:yes stop_codon:yes gene_type:complete
MSEKTTYSEKIKSLMGVGIFVIVALLMIVGIGNLTSDIPDKNLPPKSPYENWFPEETITQDSFKLKEYEDSLVKVDSVIISLLETKDNLDSIKLRLERINSKLDTLLDSLWDDEGCMHSIYEDEYVMWITGDGDTIWE